MPAPAPAPVAPAPAAAPSPNATPAARASAPAAPAPAKPAAPAKSAPAKPAAAAKPAAPAKPAPTPAKITNPFDQANADMARFADPETDEPTAPGAPKPAPKPAKPAVAEDPEAQLEDKTGEEGDEVKPGDEGKPAAGDEGKPPADGKPGKTSPWKLVESYKQHNARLQQELADIRLAQKPGELPKEHQERFASIEARNKELEDEIRHVNFSKSKEFAEKFQQPYEEAWLNAISDLKELTITNDDGSSRVANAQDLIALSNMPLGQARATAKQWFGDSADDVMAHRRTIRDLSDKQNKALEESKKGGGEREQQRTAEMQAKQKARSEETAKVWTAVNKEAQDKYEYLRPVEGETERNEKLEKATAFIDDTLKKNLNQAKTVEERDAIIKAHAAMRNRAIGFSVLKHENKSLKAKVAELETAIAAFQDSEPGDGQRRPSDGGAPAGGDEMANSLQRMTNYVT
jgi:hypothetical protein